MQDRARAIALLQQARDILMERLTERLLESRDAILEDALGLSYSSEIDAVQEQIGLRLNHINVLLNNLPPVEEPPAETEEAPTAQTAPVLGYEPPTTTPTMEAATEEFVAPPPVIYVASDAQPASPPNFQDFLRFVMAGDLDAAGRTLGLLLDVTPERGRQCAERFRDQLRERPHVLQTAMELRQELASGSVNGALILLWECFGLQGVESLAALQKLKARLAVTGDFAEKG